MGKMCSCRTDGCGGLWRWILTVPWGEGKLPVLLAAICRGKQPVSDIIEPRRGS